MTGASAADARGSRSRVSSALRNGRTGFGAAAPALRRIAKGDDLELARFAAEALKYLSD